MSESADVYIKNQHNQKLTFYMRQNEQINLRTIEGTNEYSIWIVVVINMRQILNCERLLLMIGLHVCVCNRHMSLCVSELAFVCASVCAISYGEPDMSRYIHCLIFHCSIYHWQWQSLPSTILVSKEQSVYEVHSVLSVAKKTFHSVTYINQQCIHNIPHIYHIYFTKKKCESWFHGVDKNRRQPYDEKNSFVFTICVSFQSIYVKYTNFQTDWDWKLRFCENNTNFITFCWTDELNEKKTCAIVEKLWKLFHCDSWFSNCSNVNQQTK